MGLEDTIKQGINQYEGSGSGSTGSGGSGIDVEKVKESARNFESSDQGKKILASDQGKQFMQSDAGKAAESFIHQGESKK